ncbi:unannotated protein [freshwater metagenome]|uniref:Unannotated protein n=1 Tax=freshwater metagenome TaxID=449393 RepID=A0A6J7XRQ0_9ZZZZ|nr:MFS transporter [Actinomycetota bacterium]
MLANKDAIRKGLPIFLVAMNMRASLTVMSPLIPILKTQYNLSSFALSFLTSLTVLCFAGSAFLMPLVARIGGTNRVISASLAVLTFSIFVRTVGTMQMLFVSSLGVGIAIAVLNFTLPVWVKENTPNHSGLLTGIYITIMGVFAAASIAVAVPLAQLTSLGWRLSMIPWLAIALVSSVWWMLRVNRSAHAEVKPPPARFHKNLFRKAGAWNIAIFFGLQSMLFYGTATWLPTILVAKGFTLSHAGLIVSIAGLLGSLVGIAAPHYSSRLRDLRTLLTLLGVMISGSFIGLIFDNGWHLIMWMIIANIGLSLTFPLSLLLTVTRSIEASETRSLSIMAQAIGYIMAAFAPGLVGAVYDSSLNWNVALIVPVVLGLVLGVFGYFAGNPEKIIP